MTHNSPMGFPVRLDNRFMWVAWLSFLPLVRKRKKNFPSILLFSQRYFLYRTTIKNMFPVYKTRLFYIAVTWKAITPVLYIHLSQYMLCSKGPCPSYRKPVKQGILLLIYKHFMSQRNSLSD